MKDILLFLWQFPQNIISFFLFAYIALVDPHFIITSDRIVITDAIPSGISLGFFIFLRKEDYDMETLKHETGHRKQSLRYGLFYLFVIGIPSLARNIWDICFHKKWNIQERTRWYYSHFPELQADRLGGVNRNGV